MSILSLSAISQQIEVTLSSVKACKGDTINVSVDVTGFSNICAVGVRVKYNSSVLKYIDCVNLNKDLQQAAYAEVSGFVTLGWFSSSPTIIANFIKGKLYDIKFIYLDSVETELVIVEDATIASDCNLNPVEMKFINSKIIPDKNCKK
jgi:hypothetical protein